MTELALIGFGEVGQAYATGLTGLGRSVAACDISPTEAARAKASELGIPLHDEAGEWLADIPLVIGCVQGFCCLKAARDALPFMSAGACYLDFASADPDHKRQAAAEARALGVGYVDVALVGAPSIHGIRSPVILAGDRADFAEGVFTQIGAPARIVPGEAGAAIALKLLRSGFIKGLEALAVDTFSADQQQGLRDVLFEILRDIDESPFSKFVELLVRTHPLHARRRMHELEEAERQLHKAGLSSPSLAGVKNVYRQSLAAIDAGEGLTSSSSAGESLDWVLRIRSKQK